MSLATYRRKRAFDRTPEPRGETTQGQGQLRFVVQKHQARRLHYDFRLELDGTLKSWAVPKGPSLDPQDKRLAVMVEDHPLDYRTFEGTIPKGNYGAGAVMVWDEGTYCSRQTADRQEGQRLLREGLHKGHLTIVLNGQKLKGEFSLIKLKHGEDNAWLLVKKADRWASSADVTKKDRSVATGRNLDEIAANRPARLSKTKTTEPASNGRLKAAKQDGIKGKMPRRIKPMLATPVDRPFDRPGWLFEVKWDGYRAIADVDRERVSLYSRNYQSFEDRFAPVVESLRTLGHRAVLDGELVVVDEQGRSQFHLLQNYQKSGAGRLRYYVFDLLYLDGRDLRHLPLRRRKELLQPLLEGRRHLFLSEHLEEEGIAFFKAAAAQGLEGIIAKNGASPYLEGVRSHQWVKIKTYQRQEAVICGFTEPRGSRKGLGALVLGVFEGEELRYVGHTGGGFDTRDLADMRSRLEPLVQKACPFRTKPKTNAPVHWVAPKLVCEVTFLQWTQDGLMREPIFIGLREDKAAHTVHREMPQPAPVPDEDRRPKAGGNSKVESPPKAHQPQTQTAPSPNRSKPLLTNMGKLYWPDEGYTKGDLVDYYREIGPVILPYLHDRPQSLHRHPNGITGKSFFQKDVSRQPPPDWVETVTIRSDSEEDEITQVLCQDEATLLYLANLGCIELNPWSSRIGALDHPDFLILDLDPESLPFGRVVEVALAVRKTLEKAGAACYCKTSGKRGLHIFLPLGAQYDYDQARRFAEIVANLVHKRLPGLTSLIRSPALRQGRVYLDYLQNRRGQTVVAPYSLRPLPGATVSTPLKWAEVNKRLSPGRFTMRTMAKRLDMVGDLWQPVLAKGIDLSACLERLIKG